jgi:hypothetical protein
MQQEVVQIELFIAEMLLRRPNRPVRTESSASARPVPVQMWQGQAPQSRCRRGQG